ncbi:nucleic acid-binding protein [Grapevine virus L]|uniref:Nucleic acid-binding protein n=1 Tax=Grapevine virus L TaxID=2283237 RepID=A0A6N0A1A8_9VIRU|nr:nucleic acid-binding protein [Grapevine virus L]QKO00408.1 nucleic acid-binding protein [Grapevine virus L]QKO00413.1 nucleic acid-binding protein [Grapevine virus L]
MGDKYMGSSRSANKRRAKRYGRCYCCGRLDCNGNVRTTISQDLVKQAIRTPAIRFLTENEGNYINAAINLALTDVERIGKSEYQSKFKYNKAPMGMRSPEETPEFYNFGTPDFNAG